MVVAIALVGILSAVAAITGALSLREQAQLVHEQATRDARQIAKYREDRAAYEHARERDAQADIPESSRNLYLGTEGISAVLPPAPLGALSVGPGAATSEATITMHGLPFDLFAQAPFRNPSHALATPLDLVFVATYIYPLILIALCHDLLSREREQGTLSLLLAQPLCLHTVLAAKTLTRWAVATALVAIPAIATAAVTEPLASIATWGRLSMWCAVIGTYGAFWTVLALAVNLSRRGSESNALLLAMLWVVITMIVPATLGLYLEARYPMSSRATLTQRARQMTNLAEGQRDELLNAYRQTHHEQRPPQGAAGLSIDAQRYYAVHDHVLQVVRPAWEAYESRGDERERTVSMLRFLSPSEMVLAALRDLCGTGAARQRRFRRTVQDLQGGWQAFFIPRVFTGESLSVADYEALPRLRWAEGSWGAEARRAAGSWAGLAMWGLMPLLATWHRARRAYS